MFGLYDEPVDMNVGATQGWIYLRAEYPHARRVLVEAIDEFVAVGDHRCEAEAPLGRGGKKVLNRSYSRLQHAEKFPH